jgi:hypothetical protein
MPRKRYEYTYKLVQTLWDPILNKTVLSENLTDFGIEGWRIIKIVPREKDFFEIFLEREYIPNIGKNPYLKPSHEEDPG